MGRVSGRRERLQTGRLLLDLDHVLRSNRERHAVDVVEDVAVDAPRRLDEPRRIDEVWCADGVHVNLDVGWSRTTWPAAPAWSRWMWDSSRCRISERSTRLRSSS